MEPRWKVSQLQWIRILRVLCFAIAYFFVHLILLFFFLIGTYSDSPELAWYLQHPWQAFWVIIFEVSRSPILLISFFSMIVYVLVLGFVTDWILILLKKHVLHRR